MLWKTSKKMASMGCPAAKNFEKLVRRVTFLLIGTGLLIAVLMVSVTGYTLYRINRAVNEVTEPLAPLVPIVRSVTEPLQRVEKSDEMKKTWEVLKQDQIETLEELKEKTLTEALWYSNRQAEKIEDGVIKLTEWWKNRKNNE